MTLEEDGFGAEQIKAPQTVFGLTQEGEPGWALVLSLWTIMRRQNPPNGVLVYSSELICGSSDGATRGATG